MKRKLTPQQLLKHKREHMRLKRAMKKLVVNAKHSQQDNKIQHENTLREKTTHKL